MTLGDEMKKSKLGPKRTGLVITFRPGDPYYEGLASVAFEAGVSIEQAFIAALIDFINYGSNDFVENPEGPCFREQTPEEEEAMFALAAATIGGHMPNRPRLELVKR
jgi:hypothetical protein